MTKTYRQDSFEFIDRNLEDWLGQPYSLTDGAALTNLLRGRHILITGAGGRIGRALCQQALQHEPAALTIVGRGENSVLDCVAELSGMPGISGDAATIVQPVIADIRCQHRLAAVVAEHRPDIIFHAAAHKHLPLMEQYPAEAVINNVEGTWHTLRAAEAAGVKRVVLLSTARAIQPRCIVDATKRVAELLMHRYAVLTGRPYVTMRIGNVLGANGTIVQEFRRQIAAGGPISIPHPDIPRPFVTNAAAARSVLLAATLGDNDEVFAARIGTAVKLGDLARRLIEAAGLRPNIDIRIKFMGHGKTDPLLGDFVESEEPGAPTDSPAIYRVPKRGGMPLALLETHLQDILFAARNAPAQLDACLCALLSEYAR